ncbi:zeta toxin family protein [Rhodococcus triatomae]
MLTPADIDARRQFLESQSTATGPLNVNAPGATVNNRLWFRRTGDTILPTAARRRLHRQIIDRWQASNPHVVRNRSAIIMAGPPGAGKSSTREHLFSGRDERQWRDLDADEFKRELLEHALADGTLQQLLPEDLRAEPGQAGLFHPFELSALVHQESTDFLFRPALDAAVERGDNLVIDGTLSWKPHADRMLTDLSQAGYTIQVVDVEAPKDVAAARMLERWRRGFVNAVTTPTDPDARLGGRWVPPTAVDGLFTETRHPDGAPLHGKSVTEVNAREVSATYAAVSRLDVYRTTVVNGAAEHEARFDRIDGTLRQTLPAALPPSLQTGLHAAATAHPVRRRTRTAGPRTSGTTPSGPGSPTPLPDRTRDTGYEI